MRNLFLCLLLANLLFLGWRYWVAPPEVSAPAPAGGSQPQDLRIAATTPPAGGPQARGAAGSCARVGPIAEGQILDALRSRLAEQRIRSSSTSEEGEVWVGHWVKLEDIASREEADRIAARLAAGGVTDAYVVQGEAPYTVSLGVFRDLERAEAVAAAATGLGLAPRISAKYRPGTRYWLVLDAAAAADLPVQQLSREGGQPVRVEPAACPGEDNGAGGGR